MSQSLTLYDVEEEYLAFLDTEDGGVAPELEEAFRRELAIAFEQAVEKREKFGQFLLWCSSQQEQAKKEIDRLRRRNETFANVERRLKRYAVDAIKSWGTDNKGKYRKLVGRTVTLWVRALPSSVDILDEEAVPAEYKRVTVEMPLPLWQQLAAEIPLEGVVVKSVSVPREPVEAALVAGRDVPGADLRLAGHDHTLVVK